MILVFKITGEGHCPSPTITLNKEKNYVSYP